MLGFILTGCSSETKKTNSQQSTVEKEKTASVEKADELKKSESKINSNDSTKEQTTQPVTVTNPATTETTNTPTATPQVAPTTTVAVSPQVITVSYQITTDGKATANIQNGDTIKLKVGDTIDITRTDNLDRNNYYDRFLISVGAIDWKTTGENLKVSTIKAVKPGTSSIQILPLDNWDNEYKINVEVD